MSASPASNKAPPNTPYAWLKVADGPKPSSQRISPNAAYACSCGTSLVHGKHQLNSSQFNGYKGPALLFSQAENLKEAAVEMRQMTTGEHDVADIFCSKCDILLGWKYISAAEPSQKYKEGQYLIDLALLVEESA